MTVPEPAEQILLAEPSDAGELLTVQRAAYLSEAQQYGDPYLPPLVQTLDELREQVAAGRVLKALAGTRIVGTVRVRPDGEVLHVGRLAVAPDRWGRGLGTRLLAAAERLAGPQVRHFALFTGEDSAANVRLYERCGYAVVRHEALPAGPGVVHLEKPRPQGS